ncbi:MAG: glucose-6-phosphate isomerase [Moraxellaceae bacterium]|nr:glucose-6-phosphate isomerase [Pseudobdellovibrionaceae bacterium]
MSFAIGVIMPYSQLSATANHVMVIFMLNLKTFKQSPLDLKPALLSALAQVKKNKSIGYLTLPFKDAAWAESKTLGQSIRKNYDHLVVVGIGGSSMGSRCLAEFANSPDISFLDNIDSLETESVISKVLKLGKVAYLFVSKSGTTIEILWTLDLIFQKHEDLKKSFWEHTFFITELTGNTLHGLAQKHMRPCLEIPLDVGGRFSVLTPVGLLVASFLEIDLDLIQQGAQNALLDEKHIVHLSEQFLASMDRQENITVFWFYSSRLRWFGFWLQQLWAESLGKTTDRAQGKAYPFSTPLSCIGASDQHSVLQQIMDGPKDKFVSIFRFKDIEGSEIIRHPMFPQTQNMKGLQFGSLIKAETLATQKSLDTQGVSTALIEFDELSPKTLGYLFMLFQLIVSTMAEFKNINAYDQPAVEHGKKLIRDYLNA